MYPKKRPKYLNLFYLLQHMPMMAIVSIAHRVSGVLLFFSLPWLLYWFHLSLQGPDSYQQVLDWCDSIWFKGFALVFAWSLSHHFLAGIRYLLLDIDIGIEHKVAKQTAITVSISAVLIAGMIFLGTALL